MVETVMMWFVILLMVAMFIGSCSVIYKIFFKDGFDYFPMDLLGLLGAFTGLFISVGFLINYIYETL